MNKIFQYPFTKDCQWWAPVELITRLLLIVFIIVDIGNLVSVLQYLSRVAITYVNIMYLIFEG